MITKQIIIYAAVKEIIQELRGDKRLLLDPFIMELLKARVPIRTEPSPAILAPVLGTPPTTNSKTKNLIDGSQLQKILRLSN